MTGIIMSSIKRIKDFMKLSKNVIMSFFCTLKNNISKKALLYVLVFVAVCLVSYIRVTSVPVSEMPNEKETVMPADEAYIDKREFFKSVKLKPLKGIDFEAME